MTDDPVSDDPVAVDRSLPGVGSGRTALAASGAPMEADPPWRPWTPEEVAAHLAHVQVRWYVVAGWALDLYRGETTRAHEDIEIGVPSGSFASIRQALSRYECEVVGSVDGTQGRRWPLDSQAFDEHFQTWFRDPASGAYTLDVFRDPHDDDTWLCRRDTSIRLPYDQVIRTTASGIPYMAPEIVLLFKAKPNRDKDRTDFLGVLPLLAARERAWLAATLERVHPGHAWLADL